MNTLEICNICGSTQGEVIETVDPKDLLGVELSVYLIVRCANCGLIYAVGNKDPSFLRGLYDEGYFDGKFKGGYRGYAARRHESVKRCADSLATIERLIPNHELILDVDCAVGFFLEAARDRGWNGVGVEHSSFAAAEARRHGLDVLTGTLHDGRFPDNQFDVVTFFSSIAHMADPSENVRETFRILRPGGMVLITTPNQETFSEDQKSAGIGWYRAPGVMPFP